MTTEEHIYTTLVAIDNALCDLKNYSMAEVEEVYATTDWTTKPEEELLEVIELLRYRGEDD